MSLVECIPNFSEGRDPSVVNAIVDVIRAQNVHVLDVSMDPDHNRSVVTFIGEPNAVAQAAVDSVLMAAERIDLTEHTGVHPRIGAADVVPFVPLRAITLADCVQLAERVGQTIGEQGIPVYLYEAAARRPERQRLEVVRRGGYEALRTEIALPERQPDFGPCVLRRAGAVAIGARGPLIAFNVYLDTGDVEIARSIARRLRTSGGGLPHLKAIGVLVGGRAQVSMNLTDFRTTSIRAVMASLHEEAKQHGVSVLNSELIGLIPQRALLEYAIESLNLSADTHRQILEFALGSTVGDYRPIQFE